jgi:hypothetical protein
MMGLLMIVDRPSLCRLDIEVALQKRSTMEGRYGGGVPSVVKSGLGGAMLCTCIHVKPAA